MNKQSLYIPVLFLLVLFSLGIFVGTNSKQTDADNLVTSTQLTPSQLDVPTISIITPSETNSQKSTSGASSIINTDYLESLESKVSELEMRVTELEQTITASQQTTNRKSAITQSESRIIQMNNTQTKASLLNAGINETIADDIIRRRNETELKRLELHDRATRDGYLNTQRYQNELTDLISKDLTLREALGDDNYDRYLYANRRPNRVKITSIIIGSVAEQSDIKAGDLILSYGEHRIFDWSELKQATSEGDLAEYVSLDILRDGQLINLSVPRGPLGVRLGIARIQP